MEGICRVSPLQHARDERLRSARIALCQHIRLLVVSADKTGRRRIAFAPDQVLKHAKAGSFPRCDKPFSLGEAAERDTEPVTPQHAISLGTCRRKPRITVII